MSDMSASCCLDITPNVNFNHGVEYETDVKFNEKIQGHDGAVHRVDDGSGHRGLRFQLAPEQLGQSFALQHEQRLPEQKRQ